MRPSVLLVGLAVGLAACGADGEPGPAAPEGSTTVNPAPGLEADTTAPAVQAEDPSSVGAATDRLLAYVGAHAEGDAAADTLWGPDGPPPDADFDVEPFRQSGVRLVGAVVEEPGRPEGAAGSTYLQVPMTLTVRPDDGERRNVRLVYTLRRVNDVPGAEPWSLRWHLAGVEADSASGAGGTGG